MPRGGHKRAVVFKADAELADFLASLPNASAFIRQAVVAELRMRCPLCRGVGRVAIGVGEHYAGVVRAHPPPPDSPGKMSSDGVQSK